MTMSLCPDDPWGPRLNQAHQFPLFLSFFPRGGMRSGGLVYSDDINLTGPRSPRRQTPDEPDCEEVSRLG